jgi:hypothetical protein
MSMKIKLATSLALIVFLLFAGCGPAVSDKTDTPGAKEPEKPGYEYELIEDVGALPQEIGEVVQELKTQKGYFPLPSPESSGNGQDRFLLISSGEKPTGGYSIALKSVEVGDGVTNILVEEKEPGKGKVVIQVITYPFIILKISGCSENFKVKNTAGEIFTEIIPEREKDL